MDKILAPIKQRILKYIENQHIKKEDFFKNTSIASANLKGDGLYSELGGEKIANILTFYKSVNALWLITGEGEMLNEPTMPVATDWKAEHDKLNLKYTEVMEKLIACTDEKDKLKKRLTNPKDDSERQRKEIK